jgi:hypothetical protein
MNLYMLLFLLTHLPARNEIYGWSTGDLYGNNPGELVQVGVRDLGVLLFDWFCTIGTRHQLYLLNWITSEIV